METVIDFATLEPLAQEVNSESNELNTIIENINGHLAKFKFGLSVWIPHFLEENMRVQTSSSQEEGNEVLMTPDFYVGYYRWYNRGSEEKVWQLCVRYDNDDPSDGYLVKALLEGSRDERVAGLENLSAIVDNLKYKAEKMVKTIRNAKTLVVK